MIDFNWIVAASATPHDIHNLTSFAQRPRLSLFLNWVAGTTYAYIYPLTVEDFAKDPIGHLAPAFTTVPIKRDRSRASSSCTNGRPKDDFTNWAHRLTPCTTDHHHTEDLLDWLTPIMNWFKRQPKIPDFECVMPFRDPQYAWCWWPAVTVVYAWLMHGHSMSRKSTTQDFIVPTLQTGSEMFTGEPILRPVKSRPPTTLVVMPNLAGIYLTFMPLQTRTLVYSSDDSFNSCLQASLLFWPISRICVNNYILYPVNLLEAILRRPRDTLKQQIFSAA